MDYDFEQWWKNHGKYSHEVIYNPRELEKDFKNFAYKVYKQFKQSENICDSCGYRNQNK